MTVIAALRKISINKKVFSLEQLLKFLKYLRHYNIKNLKKPISGPTERSD
jgi:hypothetical protein